MARHGSPASNGGRGLKHSCSGMNARKVGFARQQWRAWIETASGPIQSRLHDGSPASNGGRGLKPV